MKVKFSQLSCPSNLTNISSFPFLHQKKTYLKSKPPDSSQLVAISRISGVVTSERPPIFSSKVHCWSPVGWKSFPQPGSTTGSSQNQPRRSWPWGWKWDIEGLVDCPIATSVYHKELAAALGFESFPLAPHMWSAGYQWTAHLSRSLGRASCPAAGQQTIKVSFWRESAEVG